MNGLSAKTLFAADDLATLYGAAPLRMGARNKVSGRFGKFNVCGGAIKIYESPALSTPGKSIQGGDEIWVGSAYVDMCQYQGNCNPLAQILLGEYQHTKFGGSMGDPQSQNDPDDPNAFINVQLEQMVKELKLGNLDQFKHGPEY